MSVYVGNSFNVDHEGDDWSVWRLSDDNGNRQEIILTTDAMDELRDYFAEYYAEDKT